MKSTKKKQVAPRSNTRREYPPMTPEQMKKFHEDVKKLHNRELAAARAES